MTDQERIKRLAKWMGWHIEQWSDSNWFCSSAGKITEVQHWNPLDRIQDAWMLVEKITSLPKTSIEAEKALNTKFMFWWQESNLWACSAKEAAQAICIAIEKLIEAK